MAISAKTCAITATVGFAAAVAVLYITKDDKIETTLTGKEVKKLFDELFMQMQKCVAARAKEVQTQAAMLAQQGGTIPPKAIKAFFKQSFQTDLAGVSKAAYDEMGVTEVEVEAAVKLYEDEEDVAKSVKRLRDLYMNFAGEEDEKPLEGLEEFDLAKAMEVADCYMDSFIETMASIVASVKSQGQDVSDPAVNQSVMMAFQKMASDKADEKIMKTFGISTELFQAGLQKHQESKEMGMLMQQKQMMQQQAFMQMGLKL